MNDEHDNERDGSEDGAGKGPEESSSGRKAHDTLDRVVEKVQEMAPIVGAKLQDGAEIVSRKVREVAPVVGDRMHEGAGIIARKVQEVAPVVGGKVQHGAVAVVHKVQEATPIVDKMASEGVAKAGEVLEDLRQRVNEWSANRGHEPEGDTSNDQSAGKPSEPSEHAHDQSGEATDPHDSTGGQTG
jgi:hypothetical protein